MGYSKSATLRTNTYNPLFYSMYGSMLRHNLIILASAISPYKTWSTIAASRSDLYRPQQIRSDVFSLYFVFLPRLQADRKFKMFFIQLILLRQLRSTTAGANATLTIIQAKHMVRCFLQLIIVGFLSQFFLQICGNIECKSVFSRGGQTHLLAL